MEGGDHEDDNECDENRLRPSPPGRDPETDGLSEGEAKGGKRYERYDSGEHLGPVSESERETGAPDEERGNCEAVRDRELEQVVRDEIFPQPQPSSRQE